MSAYSKSLKVSHPSTTDPVKQLAMKRILNLVDQSRIALAELESAVRDATAAGVGRRDIVRAIHRNGEEALQRYCELASVADLLHALRSPVSAEFLRLGSEPVASMKAIREAVIEDGFNAERADHSLASCPYGSDQSTLQRNWKRGWNASRAGQSLASAVDS